MANYKAFVVVALALGSFLAVPRAGAEVVVKDADDRIVHQVKALHVEVNDAGTGTATYEISYRLKRLGFYRVYATLSDGTKLPAIGSRPEGYATFAILRDPKLKKAYAMPYTHFMAEGGGWRGFMGGGAWRQHQSGGQWRHLERDGRRADGRAGAQRLCRRHDRLGGGDGHRAFPRLAEAGH